MGHDIVTSSLRFLRNLLNVGYFSGTPPAKLHVMWFSSFSEKKQKRWFCLAEEYSSLELGKADPGIWAFHQLKYTLCGFLLFQKRSKSVGSASQKNILTRNSAKPTQGVWGHAPSFFHLKIVDSLKERRALDL
jgi:hypothetical protein